MASWITPFLPSPGKQWWGTKFLDKAFEKVAQVVDGKAAADHEHVQGGTTVITRGDDTARAATDTTLHLRVDVDQAERVVDGEVASILASQKWVNQYTGQAVQASGFPTEVLKSIGNGTDYTLHSLSEDTNHFDLAVVRSSNHHSTSIIDYLKHSYDSVDTTFLAHSIDSGTGAHQYIIPIIGGAAGAAEIKVATSSGGTYIGCEVTRILSEHGGIASALVANGGRPITAYGTYTTLHAPTVPAGEIQTFYVLASNTNSYSAKASAGLNSSLVLTEDIDGLNGQELLAVLTLPPGTHDVQVYCDSDNVFFTGFYLTRKISE